MSLPNAITREDFYLNKIANPSDDHELPDAITREQHYLKAIAENMANGEYDFLIVHVTKSGDNYIADYTWDEIFSKSPQVIVLYETRVYICTRVQSNRITFKRDPAFNGSGSILINGESWGSLTSVVSEQIIVSASSVTHAIYRYACDYIEGIESATSLSTEQYQLLQSMLDEYSILHNGVIYSLSKYNTSKTEFDFANAAEGVTAHIAADRSITFGTL